MGHLLETKLVQFLLCCNRYWSILFEYNLYMIFCSKNNFRGTRFDTNKDKGPHIDTWTNEQAETNAEKENIGCEYVNRVWAMEQ